MNTIAPFIQSIHINKVRHLQDILISIDDSRPRHLIITGPNGCGKTSLLCFIRDYLEGIPNKNLLQVSSHKKAVDFYKNQLEELNSSFVSEDTNEKKAELQTQIYNTLEQIRNLNLAIEKFTSVELDISDLAGLVQAYHQGEFLIGFFEARRFSQIQPVNGAHKLDLPKISPITVKPGSLSSNFLQFLVNQENRAALLLRKGKQDEVNEIQDWMDKLTKKFRELFQDENLTLEYDIDNFDFIINMPGREPFRLVDNQLSDGFSSVIQIISELLLRMEAVKPGHYDIPGIVLIDEIETHLHIRLQKIILPFLASFFPKIQFIVTTHSPFILTSLNDAIVFDLDTHKRLENMAPMTASTVVETYFDQDLYSNEIVRQVARYKELANKPNPDQQESEELNQLRTWLDKVNYEEAPELFTYYQSLRARELTA